MPSSFFRAERFLESDHWGRHRAGLIIGLGLLGLWSLWFFLARTSIHAVSDAAELEVDQQAHPLEVPLAGRVVATHLILGQQVEAGEALVELDAESQHLALGEERSRVTAFSAELEALEGEIAATRQADTRERQAEVVVLGEARDQLREAQAYARFAEENAERHRQLYEAGLGPAVELHRAQSEAEARQADADRLRLALDRIARQQQAQGEERQAHLRDLEMQASRLAGELATSRAAIQRLEHDVELRKLRAPVSGRLGQVANIEVGTVVSQGERLATIVPPGPLRLVAYFPPATALGHIRPGQSARLRLAGFPWTQYGSIPAAVAQVGSEVRDGHIRVELSVRPDPSVRVPLQHGLPGVVEVQVERISPAAMVLRIAGGLLAVREPVAETRGPGANP
jgi:membrane fusion protein (multidrug efflux system)